jgi:hypothetical protein
MCLRHLDVVAEDLVETDFQRRNACAFPLVSLQSGDVLFASVAEASGFVELGIGARPDGVARSEGGRGRVDQRACKEIAEISEKVELVGVRLQQLTRLPSVEPVEAGLHVRQTTERVAEPSEVAGARAVRSGATGQPFDVAHALESFADAFAATGVVCENGDARL